MDKINTVLVAFSAISIHKELAMRALDVAEQNNAKLIILSVRDKKVAEKVAKMTKDQGFLGEKVVEKLKGDIIMDRNRLISRKLSMLENEAEKREIVFETVRVKGNFVENVIETVNKYGVDVLLLDDIGKKIDKIKENISCDIVRLS
jgi:nucleotide-binding universal stress UspA family protein